MAYAIKSLVLHISLLWAFVPKLGHHLNQPSWTLSVFFICYALTPAFSAFMNWRGKNSLWLLYLGSWLMLLLSVLYFNELPNIFRGISFFSGMLLGKLFLESAIPLPKRALLNDIFLIFAAILLCVNICYFRFVNTGLSYHFISPLLQCVLLLFLANDKGFIVKIFSVSWLRAIGKASFYTYLLHCVVIEFLHLYLDKVARWEYNPFNNPLATVAIMVLLYGCCTAYGSWKGRYSSLGSTA
jgi:peptidoglycan/LPS O-acetylase OafA/YrhL